MGLVRSVVKRFLPARTRARVSDVLGQIRRDRHHYEREQRREFMRRAFAAQKFNGVSGDYLEFGCWGGMTFSLAYEESRRHGFECTLWAFDSFQGLPPQSTPEDAHPVWQPGALRSSLEEFHEICHTNGMPRSAYRVVPGFYEDTIGREHEYGQPLPKDIAVAYVDCDLYSSTISVLTFLESRMKHGMIVAFDDYFCWSSTAVAGERKACIDFLASQERFAFTPYTQFGWHGMSFVVEDRALLVPRSLHGATHMASTPVPTSAMSAY